MKKHRGLLARTVTFMFLGAVVLLWFGAGEGFAGEVVKLRKGQQRTMPVENLVRVAIADDKVADVRLLSGGTELLIMALAPGFTDLTTWDAANRTNVITIIVGKSMDDMASEIGLLLKTIDGIDVRVVGEKVVIDGKVLTKEKLSRVETIAEAYPEILNLVTLDDTMHNQLLADLLEEKIGMIGVGCNVVGRDRVILQGVVFNEKDKERAGMLAAAHFANVVNALEVEDAMVEIDLKFVEINMDKGRDVGSNVLKNLSITGALGLDGVGSAIAPPAYNIALNAMASLNYLVSNGAANVLQQPHLSTVSGQKASFHQGGEFGFRVESSVGAGMVEWKEFGLLMDVEPTVSSTGEITNRIYIEVSAPVATAGTSDIAFTKFTTESVSVCKMGESVVISGLVQNIQNKFQEKTPVLGDIPLLKLFFSETKDSTVNKELVVLVTPTVPTLIAAQDHIAGSAGYEELIKRVEEGRE